MRLFGAILGIIVGVILATTVHVEPFALQVPLVIFVFLFWFVLIRGVFGFIARAGDKRKIVSLYRGWTPMRNVTAASDDEKDDITARMKAERDRRSDHSPEEIKELDEKQQAQQQRNASEDFHRKMKGALSQRPLDWK